MSEPAELPQTVFQGPRRRNPLRSVRTKTTAEKNDTIPSSQSLQSSQHETSDCQELNNTQSTVEEDQTTENVDIEDAEYTEPNSELLEDDYRKSFEENSTQELLFQVSHISKESYKDHVVLENQPNYTANYKWIILVIVSLVVIAMLLRRSSQQPPVLKQKHCDQFLKLGSKYPIADMMIWKTLNISVNRAFYHNPGEPTTFIFLHNSSAIEDSFLEDIIRITSDCNKGRQPIHYNSADFRDTGLAHDHTAFLERHKLLLEEKGILVVQDLDQIPPSTAKVFFTIVDSFEPLVAEAIIFFTLDISRQPQYAVNLQHSATEIAEEILKNLWKHELNENMLIPLLTRLTDNVFKIGF